MARPRFWVMEGAGHCFGDDDYRIFKAFQLCTVGNELAVRKGKEFFKVGGFGRDLLEVAIDPFLVKLHRRPPGSTSSSKRRHPSGAAAGVL